MKAIEETVARIESPNHLLESRIRRRLDSLTKPRGSLGRLEDFAMRVAVMTGDERPNVAKKVIFTLAGDHGVVEEGVSAFPQEVTSQMVYNFLRGGAGINVLAKHIGARVVVADMGVAQDLSGVAGLCHFNVMRGTRNMVRGPAMTLGEARRCIESGIALFEDEVERGIDIVGVGDMGIGNTTPSSAIASVVTRAAVESLTGRGTGIDDAVLQRKIRVIEKGIETNAPDPKDGLDVLAKVGGCEIGGIAGVILAAAARRIPVVLDGFITGAGALIAALIEPKAKEYMFASHCSVEPGHRIVLEWLGLDPILNLGLRLGEGTGAALAMFIIEAGVKILNEMASFDEARVSRERDL